MINKPRCAKAQTKVRDMALFCEGKFLCAHQYYCNATRRYENTPGFGACKRMNPQQMEETVNIPVAQPSPAVENATLEPVAKQPVEVQTAEPQTASSAIPANPYTEAVMETAAEETTNKETGRRQLTLPMPKGKGFSVR